MMRIIINNIGTVAAGSAVILLALISLFTVIKDRKSGRSSCGCGCSHCAMAESCHRVKDHEDKKTDKNSVTIKNSSGRNAGKMLLSGK